MEGNETSGIKVFLGNLDQWEEYEDLKANIEIWTQRLISDVKESKKQYAITYAHIAPQYFSVCCIVNQNMYENDKKPNYEAYWAIYSKAKQELLTEVPFTLAKYINEDTLLDMRTTLPLLSEHKYGYLGRMEDLCKERYMPKNPQLLLDESKEAEETNYEEDEEWER